MSLRVFTFKFRNRRGEIFFQTNKLYDDMKLFKGETVIEGKFDVHIDKGTTYHPYAYLPDPYNIAISTKFREALSENKITGWGTYPIAIKDCNFEYWGLQILGRAGAVQRPAQAGWLKEMKIDMSAWDGSDVFASTNTFSIFFTEKVRNVILQNKILSEIELVDLANHEWYSVAK